MRQTQPPHSRLTKKMWNLHKPLAKKENTTELLNELDQTASCILCLSSTTAVVLGEGMAEAVVAQRQWQLALTGLREAQARNFPISKSNPSCFLVRLWIKLLQPDKKKQEEALGMHKTNQLFASQSLLMHRKVLPKNIIRAISCASDFTYVQQCVCNSTKDMAA